MPNTVRQDSGGRYIVTKQRYRPMIAHAYRPDGFIARMRKDKRRIADLERRGA